MRRPCGSGPATMSTSVRSIGCPPHSEQNSKSFRQGDEADRFEVFEGRAAGRVHMAMRDLPIAVLDDPGFWRYVSLAKFWWFIKFREAKPIAAGNHMTYVDGTRPTECVPLRMFLRAQAVREGDDYSLASSMDRATDFWRSHVLRVQTASAPALARSFARLQHEKQMPTESQLRPFARQLNRLWANVVLHGVDEAEATQLLDEIYGAGPGSEASAGLTP